ncbi:serine/threonine-protein kinase [Streptomyces cavernicola]|uniref:non-specific serine/threonine protein kinase n=1 Tax=Streptomyces cavernicola TaxID=3043613 RepID=A0ABT6S6Z3_9ACTN|nr:serine/threonine-protein kinase [Streptomyces sp. B-S-A6]MDI3403876.1 serine/threonine-protein kinase [Streptomyces sp. B-S-A6]
MTSATGGGDAHTEGAGGVKPLTAADPTHFGPYLLLGRLGAGGMGRVYLARSESGRTVAVKVVHEEHVTDDQFRARFRREIGAARKVGARYTAPVLDADPDAELPWVATGYVPGLSLEQVVRGHGPLPTEAVHALGDGMLRALADIHGAGIVHRDLKPSNVMLTVDGPRVIDFGIARAVQTDVESMLTSTGMVIGSPGFMAPEQILGESSGPKCDVFALGCLLMYAATGVLPFGHGASNQHAVMYRIVEGEPDLGRLDDERLRALVARCLTKDVAERPDVAELLADEERLAAVPSGTRLPGAVVTHLAQQSARLLDAEATTPVREESAPPAERERDQAPDPDPDPDRATAHLGGPRPKPAAPAGAAGAAGSEEAAGAEGAAEAAGVAGAALAEPKRVRRRSPWLLALPVVAVLALGGGTFAFLQDFGGPGGDDAPPQGGPAASSGPNSLSKPSSSPSGDGKDDKKKDGKDKDKDGGKEAGGAGDDQGEAGSGGPSGTDSAGSDGDAAGTGADGTGSGTSTGSDSGSADGGGSDGSGSSDGDASGGGAVPDFFVDTWRYAESANVNSQPETVTISAGGSVRMVVDVNGSSCSYTAHVTSKSNQNTRIDIGTATLTTTGVPYCYKTKDPSYFTVNGSGIQHNVGPAHSDGYYYKRS